MKFRVVLEYDPETKSYAAFCPGLPGCSSAGDTEAEALENIKAAIVLYLEPTGEVGARRKGLRGRSASLMPDRLLRLRGIEVVRILERHGFVAVSQPGSHQK